MIAVSQVLAAPAIAGVLLAPTPKLSFGLVALAYVTAETWLGPAAAIVQVCHQCTRIHVAVVLSMWHNCASYLLVFVTTKLK